MSGPVAPPIFREKIKKRKAAKWDEREEGKKKKNVLKKSKTKDDLAKRVNGRTIAQRNQTAFDKRELSFWEGKV